VPNPPGITTGAGKPDEHVFACEKVPKCLRNILIGIVLLFMRQLDVQANGGGLSEKGTFVGSLHDARPAAGYDRKARVGQQACNLLGQHVVKSARTRALPNIVTAGLIAASVQSPRRTLP
jgi:hypothetical protein